MEDDKDFLLDFFRQLVEWRPCANKWFAEQLEKDNLKNNQK